MATEGQKTIERMTQGLSDYQCRAFAALVRDIRHDEPDDVLKMRIDQCRVVVGAVEHLGDLETVPEDESDDDDTPENRLARLQTHLDGLKFEELKVFAFNHKVDVQGLISKVDVSAAIMKAAREESAK